MEPELDIKQYEHFRKQLRKVERMNRITNLLAVVIVLLFIALLGAGVVWAWTAVL